ncbi:unnamed protein product [Fraxinus pennsylvanica]|uniref:GTD-binding domain-containing protein n=1 Tax=Fraxinus pennsylvanica TaxID=56036 RepID=A0AAD1ZHW7_9LAMI|nr:unnamed protein product [Fraxinus pennsylvanica]
MCEGCLLSFAIEKVSYDCGKYKSLVGILHKDIDCFVEDFDSKNHMKLAKNQDNWEKVKENGSIVSKCSCWGEPLKTRTFSSLSMKAAAPSPQVPLLASRNEEGRNVELPNIKYMELKFDSNNESEVQKDENVSNEAQSSHRWDNRGTRKLSIDDARALNGADGDSILHCYKRQVRLDHESLMALYMELGEERSAYADASNNAMAMITRLQAKKSEEDVKLLKSELETYREKYGPNKEEDGGNPNDLLLDFEGERSHLLALSTDLERIIYSSSDEGSESSEVDNVKHDAAARGGNENKVTLKREVSLIRDRLRAIETDSDFLKHAAMTLHQGVEVTGS